MSIHYDYGMGPEIIFISGFRKNRGQKSADLVISEPRNNSFSNLSELGLFHFWILPRTKYRTSPVSTLYLVWYLPAVHVTHHPQQRGTNTHTTAHRACCVRDRVSSSDERKSSSTTIKNTTAAAQQQRQQQRRWWPNVAGDSMRARFSKIKPLSKNQKP